MNNPIIQKLGVPLPAQVQDTLENRKIKVPGGRSRGFCPGLVVKRLCDHKPNAGFDLT